MGQEGKGQSVRLAGGEMGRCAEYLALTRPGHRFEAMQ